MNPTALIADDEVHLAEHLRERLLALWPELRVLPLAANGIDALRAIEEHAPDAAFLDIRMPGLTGLELAARAGTRTRVVFVTAFDQYAVDAFDREALDYLLKPVGDERLARCVARLKERFESREPPPAVAEMLRSLARALPGGGGGRLRWIRASRGEEVRHIPVEEVLYFRAADKYTCVVTPDGESLIRLPLAELLPQLDADVFWQIHRGTIVNMEAVAGTRRDLGGRVRIRLKEGRGELPVSRAFAQRFKQM